MALPKYYAAGSISVANGATAVTGTGTAWNNIVKADDVLRVAGYSVRVASVTDNTHLTLAEAWPGTSLTDDPYEIAITYDGPEFQLRVRELLEQLRDAALPVASITAAEAYSPVIAPDFIRSEGYETAGDGGGALYKKVASEPSHGAKFSITLSDAVTVQWYEIAELAINVRMTGAKGDGSTDDTTAIQAAINAIRLRGDGGASYASRGGDVLFDAGTFIISSTISVNYSNVRLIGAGRGGYKDVDPLLDAGTIIKWSGADGGTMISVVPASVAYSYPPPAGSKGIAGNAVKGIALVSGDWPYTSAAGIGLYWCSSFGEIDIQTMEFKSAGVYMTPLYIDDAGSRLVTNNDVTLFFRQVNTSGTALVLDGWHNVSPFAAADVCYNLFRQVRGRYYDGIGIDLRVADNNVFETVDLERPSGGSGTPIQFRANSTDHLPVAQNIIHHYSQNIFSGTIVSQGTETATYPARNNSILYYDTENGTPSVSVGTGSTVYCGSITDGKQVIGYGRAVTVASGFVPKLQLLGGDASDSSALLARWGNTANGPQLALAKSRNATVGSHTVVQAEDVVGTVQFFGSDGDEFLAAAAIQVRVDTTPGNGDMPGRLSLCTTSDGGSFVAQRLIIDSSGHSYPGADNSYTIGKSGARFSAVWAANGTIQTSDARDKNVVSDLSFGAALVDAIDPVLFRWKVGHNDVVEDREAEPDEDGQYPMKLVPRPGERVHSGFLAQDVHAAMQEAGVDFAAWGLEDKDDAESRQWLRPDQLVPVLWAALKETREEVAALKARLEEQSD